MGFDPSRRGRLALAALSVTALAVPATAATAAAAPSVFAVPTAPDVRLLDGDYKGGALLPLAETTAARAGTSARTTLSARQAPGELAVGDQRDWPSLIDGGVTPDGEEIGSAIDVRGYTLRGLGDHIEVWVADDLSFPDGDCRNTVDGGALTTVTDEQAQGFADEFDETVLPAESEAFSVAPDRDWSDTVFS